MDISEIIDAAQFYILAQQYKEALKLLKDAVKKYPTNYELYYNLGIVYESLSMYDEARDAYRKVLELEPDLKEAQERLSHLIGE